MKRYSDPGYKLLIDFMVKSIERHGYTRKDLKKAAILSSKIHRDKSLSNKNWYSRFLKVKLLLSNLVDINFYFRKIKFFLQRRLRGFDESDIWWLNGTIAKFILPRLRYFRSHTISFPCELSNSVEWKKILDEMIISLESIEYKNYLDIKDIFHRWKLLKSLIRKYPRRFEFLPKKVAERNQVLLSIIITFESILKDNLDDTSRDDMRGLNLFARYFDNLWD